MNIHRIIPLLFLAVVASASTRQPSNPTYADTYDLKELLPAVSSFPELTSLEEGNEALKYFQDRLDALYTNPFLDISFNTADLTLDYAVMSNMNTVHDMLLDLSSVKHNLDLSSCKLPESTLETCTTISNTKHYVSLGLVRTVFHSEAMRARRCTMIIALIRRTSNEFTSLMANTPLLEMPYWHSSFQLNVPYSIFISPEENLNQAHEMRRQFLLLRQDMDKLQDAESRRWLQDSGHSPGLGELERALLETNRNASIVAAMEDSTLREGSDALIAYCRGMVDEHALTSEPAGVFDKVGKMATQLVRFSWNLSTTYSNAEQPE